jgi:signal transduction histidine kinase
LRIDCVLSDPDRLYVGQKRRQMIFALFLAAASLTAIAGFATARRAFYRQLKLNEMKSNFVSAVSRELRAPIASVRLLAEGLDRGKITEPQKQKEYFRFIVQECRRLTSLIENVLDYSRIEQGRKKYEMEPTDIAALLGQTVKLMSPNAEERQARIELRLPESAIPQAVCDGLAVQQALINLIDNAVKHSPPGAVVGVGISAPPAEINAAARLELWVEDQGPGIPPAEHEKIFERFYRRGSELRRETQGIGIGLTIVKHIAEAHGGRVRVQSAVGRGSRFTLELPLCRES